MKEDIKVVNKHMKICLTSITSHLGNADENHNVIYHKIIKIEKVKTQHQMLRMWCNQNFHILL